MALSSNSLMHFTEEKETLKSILSESFRVRYCKEKVDFGGRNGTATYYVPMVSFCDIPLSQIKNHISSYGEYGIGMSKSWAIRKKLNPVLYFQKGSLISASYKKAFFELVINNKEDDDGFPDGEKALSDLLRYIKNYEGDLTRKGKTRHNYRYSDEREWRFVPSYKEDNEMIYLESDGRSDSDIKQLGNSSIRDMRLSFGPDDIRYIVVRDDNDIEEFVRHLRSEKGSRFPQNVVEKLTTRIFTSQQIKEDV